MIMRFSTLETSSGRARQALVRAGQGAKRSPLVAGFTLTEMMVSVGIGVMVLLMMAVVFMTCNRSFAAMGNYINMDRVSRNALDKMTRDIRQAYDLTSFNKNKIVFKGDAAGATNLTYAYDDKAKTLTRKKTGEPDQILLSDCETLAFSMWKNVPLAGGTLGNAASVSEAKAIGVAWKCSQTVLGKTVTSEDMQQAQIVIRNKPVL